MTFVLNLILARDEFQVTKTSSTEINNVIAVNDCLSELRIPYMINRRHFSSHDANDYPSFKRNTRESGYNILRSRPRPVSLSRDNNPRQSK